MSYISKNELHHFCFDDCQIAEFSMAESSISFMLDALIVCENNTQNSNFTRSYADTAKLTLTNAELESITIAGYKVYDANDNLISEVGDRIVSKDDWKDIFKNFKEAFLFRAIEISSSEKYVYDFEIEQNTGEELIDLRLDSYILRVSFTESSVSWDRYLNRVQS